MKIYHKKNFAAGLFFTLLGAAFIVLFLVRGNIQPKSVVFCVLSLLLGPGLLLRSFDKRLSFQDRVDELDERNILVKLRTKSTAFSIVQYTLLGAVHAAGGMRPVRHRSRAVREKPGRTAGAGRHADRVRGGLVHLPAGGAVLRAAL